MTAFLLEMGGIQSAPYLDSLASIYSSEPGSCGNSLRVAFRSWNSSRPYNRDNFSDPVVTLCPSKPNPVPRNTNGYLDLYTINLMPSTRSVLVELVSDSLYVRYLRPPGTLLDALRFRIEFILSPFSLSTQNAPSCADPFLYPLHDPQFSSRVRQIARREANRLPFNNLTSLFLRKSLADLITCGSLARSSLISGFQCVPKGARCNHVIDCFGREDEIASSCAATRAFA